MAYEIYIKKADIMSDRLMEALVSKNLPFAEIEVSGEEAEELERKHGRPLPFVMAKGKLVGGFSDLVLFLRHAPRRYVRATPV